MKDNHSYVYDIRPIASMRDLVGGSCERYAGNTAFLYQDGKDIVSVTYAETFEKVKALTAFLHAEGLAGGKIAVIGKNGFPWALSYLTVTAGVGVVVPLDKDLRADEIVALLRGCGACAVLYGAEEADKMTALPDGCRAYCFSDFETYLARGKAMREEGDRSYESYSKDPTELGILLYTSGTTGVGKGVMLSQYNICSNILSVLHRVEIKETDRTLSMLPLHHTYECMAGFLSFFYAGASIAYNRSLKTLQQDLAQFRPTVLVAVPLILETFLSVIQRKYRKLKGGERLYRMQCALAQSMRSNAARRRLFSSVHAAFGGRLERVLIGAAPLNPETFRAYNRFGYRVYVGYGLTETSPVCIMHNDFYQSPDDIGYPLSGVNVRIDAPNEDGVGELVISGPNVMLGYYEDPERTAEVLRDGCFHTGDLAVRGADGTYKISGRIKSMIVAPNGKKIFPEELELFLERIPYVADALVYANETGAVTAAIYPDADVVSSKLGEECPPTGTPEYRTAVHKLLEEGIASVNAKFPSYKAIAHVVVRDREFLKTTTRKIKRIEPENQKEEGAE